MVPDAFYETERYLTKQGIRFCIRMSDEAGNLFLHKDV